MPTPSGLRLFGVAELENGLTESLPEGTSVVQHRGLGAIVEPAAYSGPKLEDADLERYAAVVNEAFKLATILPAPPGTIFKSHGTLAHWLELHYFTLTDAMGVVEGNVAARVSIGAGARVKENEAEKSFQALGAEALRLLRGHAAATVVIPVTDNDAKEGVVARASFLVASEKWDSFQSVVSQESRRQPALDVQLTGPWPPYDFVRMQFGG
jgi:hypothetical protein